MNNHLKNIENLKNAIKDKIGKPVSNRVVAATIESLGIRDKDTMNDFGLVSIRALADLVFNQLVTAPDYIALKNKKEKELEKSEETKTFQVSDYMMIKVKIFGKYYPLGILHLLPVFIQIIAIIFFGYSLWTYVGFNHMQSTAVVMGVIVGLISTGGFVQVIGRQASFYWNYEDYTMTRKTIDFLVLLGAKSIAMFMLFIFCINFIFHVYPAKLLFVLFMYAFLVGMLLLIIAPLHTIKQRWIVSFAIFLATIIAVILKQYTTISIYASHWIGISIAVISARVYLYYFFKNKIDKRQVDSNMELKKPVMLYQNYHYFFYGLLIYIFIFIDRILAWSADVSGTVPYMIYFEKKYELGMDVAILFFLLLSGVSEYSLAAFSKFIDIGQKNTSYSFAEKYNGGLYKMYWQHIGILCISGAVISTLIYFIITSSWGYQAQFNEVFAEVSFRVAIIGGISYFFLAWAMLNTLHLFTLGQPIKPLRAIVVACIVNAVTGFIASRFISYEYSVIGLFLGSLVFMLLTLKANVEFFKNLDYYYYAAY
ncbi:hypothetical protein FEDK69T_04430 [Flavobacterium enshiense DK69]|uniref:Uncharacterized protein n=1 Tax=Flavobacterium enshiense DK69 TaxID=1107311 RepID=V6SEJ2_9FLAO|nr:hypothetical protein [Flavobacterium enshiense]ESU24889.1 hypothetical protein FEDK69T_04430 [Flavobacterium enshiense DK69]KGO96666.1 hypothetical protein Q767_02850 [Flavobacterium enshiense DK69]